MPLSQGPDLRVWRRRRAAVPPQRDGKSVQVASIKTRVESAYGVCNQRLKLCYHRLLSTFAFKFILRPNVMETTLGDAIRHGFLSKPSTDGRVTRHDLVILSTSGQDDSIDLEMTSR